MASPYLVFLAIFVLIIVLQLTLKAKLFFNVKNNNGKLVLKIFCIKICCVNLSIEHGCIKLTNKKGKNKYLPLELNEQTIEHYNNFQDILFKKTYFKNISIYLNLGIKHSAMQTALICGGVDILTKILYCIFKTKKNETEFFSKIYPNFNSNVIKIGVKAKISISIYDLIWSYFESKVSSKQKERSAEYARQQNRKLNGTSINKNKTGN